MQVVLALSFFVATIIAINPAIPASDVIAAITADGSILIGGGIRVPAVPVAGKWTEFEAKSSDRYDIRHFNYMVPGRAPAIELYISASKDGETSDGVFETGFVRGYVRSFASKGGFIGEDPVFDQRLVGTATVTHTLVKLADKNRILWVHAYLVVRRPSLIFVVIGVREGEEDSIERYLAGVELK